MNAVPSVAQVKRAVASYETKLGDFGARPVSPLALWREAWTAATGLSHTPTIAAAASAVDVYGKLQHELNDRQLETAWREIVQLVPANGTKDVDALAGLVLCEIGCAS